MNPWIERIRNSEIERYGSGRFGEQNGPIMKNGVPDRKIWLWKIWRAK
jgi:hypothetical protein